MIISKIKTYLIKIWTSLIFIIPVALLLAELAYLERGYIAAGGEWLFILILLIWGCKNV